MPAHADSLTGQENTHSSSSPPDIQHHNPGCPLMRPDGDDTTQHGSVSGASQVLKTIQVGGHEATASGGRLHCQLQLHAFQPWGGCFSRNFAVMTAGNFGCTLAGLTRGYNTKYNPPTDVALCRMQPLLCVLAPNIPMATEF